MKVQRRKEKMAGAFNKEIVRSITQSAGRFAAIAIISLLGAGFYAGLRMAAPDMRIAGDDFFNGANLYDISVVTTLGLDDKSVEILNDIDGVGEVMPAYRADAMVLVGDNSYAASIESVPIGAAKASDTSDGAQALSDDEDYLNRPILLEGSWPANSKECVIGINAAEKLGIALGDTVKAEKGTADLEDTFAETSFTVTGLVNSPAYASSGQLGVTTLGTGTIELYLYVPESAFAEDMPYTVAYLTVPAARTHTWDNPAYDHAIGVVQKRVNDMAAKLGLARWNDVRAEAQKELDDARADYEKERADAEEKLADAADQLADAQAQLNEASAKLASGKADLDAAKAQLAESEAKLQSGEVQYADGKAQLEAQQAAYEEQAASLDGLKAQRDQLLAGIDQAKAGAAQLEQALAQAKAAGTPEAQIAELEAQLEAARTQITTLEGQLMQLSEGIAAIEAAPAQLAEAKAQLDASRAELDQGWKQLAEGRAKYESGLAEYESGVSEYYAGEASYVSGVAEYDANRVEAYEKFADAESELADAQADIDDIEKPDVYVMNRSKNYGAAQLSSDAEGIAQIATFLPFMFFLVAALVSLTSMTRMVDEERMIIGTHKALGYSRGRITVKYLIYAILASGIGSLIGVVLFGQLLPWIIMTAYQVTYAVPTVPTPIDPVITARAIGLSVGVTTLATWGAAAASLREKPAALMLPRTPKAGKRIFLEHITPLWSRMSFSQKVTARNLLRYKRRFFMAVIGIAGCTALLMVGFGMRDAIGGVVWNQFGALVNYDAAVRLDDDMTDEARSQAESALTSAGVDSHLNVKDFNMIAAGPDGDMRIEVVVPEDADKLPDYVTLRDRTSHEPLALEGEGLILTEKAASKLGVHVGDNVTLFDENDVGDATGDGRSFTVGGITENYLGHYAYMLPSGYRAAFGEDPVSDLVYVKIADDADRMAFSDNLLSIDGVNTVSFISDKVKTYQDMLDLMGTIIFVIIVLSAALAFVVLYNLTNINIEERIREIATLKVLGFTKPEVHAYIFREIIVMAIIGALLGCVLGVPLTAYIAQAAETPQMMFGREIAPLSYVFSFAITMVFAAVVAFTMRRKLARVNMVESLKSVE